MSAWNDSPPASWYEPPDVYEEETVELCPICDDPLTARGYGNLVTDENGTTVHEFCLPDDDPGSSDDMNAPHPEQAFRPR